jgi:hypothetical protein
MIDCQAVTAGFFAAAAAAPTRTHAARALDPLAATLQAKLATIGTDAGPAGLLRAVEHPPLTGRETEEQIADRLRLRLDELALARRFGDALDVQRMTSLAVNELRQAALARVR